MKWSKLSITLATYYVLSYIQIGLATISITTMQLVALKHHNIDLMVVFFLMIVYFENNTVKRFTVRILLSSYTNDNVHPYPSHNNISLF